MEFDSYSEKDTLQIGKELAKNLKKGDVVALFGDIGCGKTVITKGIADYFGERAYSPTFTLVNEYMGEVPIYHFDAYRLENVSAEDCDWMDDYLFSDGVCLIEWAQNIKTILPQGYTQVKIEKMPEKGEDYRKITIQR